MSFILLWVSPSINSIVIIWNCWGLSESLSSHLGSDVVSTLSNFSCFGSPLSWVSLILLRVSPSINSVIVIWNCWCLSEWSLGSNIVSSLGDLSCFGSPLSWVSFVLLWVSPGINSVVVIWNSGSLSEGSLGSDVVSTLSNFSSLSGPLGWVSFVLLRISPGVDSVVVVWNSRGLSESLSSHLGSDVVSTLSNFSCFGSPLSWVSLILLRISPSVDSIVIISYSWSSLLTKSNIISSLCNCSCFVGPLGWMIFFILCISPGINSVVIICDIWGSLLSKLIKMSMVWVVMVSDLCETIWLSSYTISENSLGVSVRISCHPWSFINEMWFISVRPSVTIISVPVWWKLLVQLNCGSRSN